MEGDQGDTVKSKVVDKYTKIPIFNLPEPVPPINRSGRFSLQQFDDQLLGLLNTNIQNIFYRDDNDNMIPCFSILKMYSPDDKTKDVPFKVVRDSNHNQVIVYELYTQTDTPIDFTTYINAVNEYNNQSTPSRNAEGGGGKRRTKKRSTK